MNTQPFSSIVHAALAVTPVNELLAMGNAVILERVALGGGATNWYYCHNRIYLEALEAQFSPGSVVSFYFDDRIQNALYSLNVRSNMERIIAETGEAVIGVLTEDGLHIAVEVVTGPKELADFASTISARSRVFFGEFPARDNDGKRAVTVVLPDADGVVRPHPH